MFEPGVNRGHGRCPWRTSSYAALLIAERVDGSHAVTCEFDVGLMFDGDEVVVGPTEINDPDEMVGL